MADVQQKNGKSSLADWVRLSLIFGAASAKAVQLLMDYESPKAVLDALDHGEVREVSPQIQKNAVAYTQSQAENLVYFCEKNDITLLTAADERYPESLSLIGVPPLLLTAKGNLDLLSERPSLTVVGTRHPSDYSVKVTQSLVTQLAADGFQIVSGFAMGIDTAAHTAALDAEGTTLAVIGCGINVNYPRENEKLRNRMLDSGRGLFLSEYLPGTQPIPANFPRRNRILSGLTNGTAVMEAALHSGSLVTAQYAAQQGKFLFCVPPRDLYDPRYVGVVPLMRDGAIGLYSHRDVLFHFYQQHPADICFDETRITASDSLIFAEKQQKIPAEAKRSTAKKTQAAAAEPVQTLLPTEPAAAESETEDLLPEDEMQRAIVSYLRENGQTHVDMLCAALDIESSALLSTLTLLELDGYVESLFGKQYRAV